jgi:hypothetical protein
MSERTMTLTTIERTITLTNQVMFGTEYEIGFEEDSYGWSGLYSYGFVGRELQDGEISWNV